MYPADLLKMLVMEKDGPSTSASGAKELIPVFGPPDRTSKAPGGQPGLGVSTGEGSGAVIVSSDKFDPGTPPSTGAGPSTGTGRAPLAGDDSDGHDFGPLVSPPQAMTIKIGSGDRDASFDSSGFTVSSTRACGWTSPTPNGTALGTSSKDCLTIVWTRRCKGEGQGSALTRIKLGTTTPTSPY
ncbi:hypothetical protein PanWU01x14_049710, partial [Parasponia andersonii]